MLYVHEKNFQDILSKKKQITRKYKMVPFMQNLKQNEKIIYKIINRGCHY